jgi:GTP cyclohydrolase I
MGVISVAWVPERSYIGIHVSSHLASVVDINASGSRYPALEEMQETIAAETISRAIALDGVERGLVTTKVWKLQRH